MKQVFDIIRQATVTFAEHPAGKRSGQSDCHLLRQLMPNQEWLICFPYAAK